MSSLKAKTLSSLRWKFLERTGSAIVAMIVQIVMARLLTPEQFGALAIMLVFINVANVIVQSGLSAALIQTPVATREDFSTVFWMSFTVSIVLYLVIFFSAGAIADFYGMQDIVWPLRVLALTLLISAYSSVQVSKVARDLEFQKVFFATICSGIGSGVFGIGSAIMGAGLWALVIQQVSYQLVTCIVLTFQIDWKPRFVFCSYRARELFGFGWKLLVSGLIDTGYQSLSDLVIGKLFTSAQLGLVSQGKKYPAALGDTLDGAIQPVMMSTISHVQDDSVYVKRIVRRALKTSTFLIVPAMTLFALLAHPLVLILLGEKWLSCVPFLQMYCFVYALLPIHTTNLQALNGMGRSDLFLKLELIKSSYGVAILLFTAYVLRDVYAIVIGYMISGVISTFVNAWPNRHVIGYSYKEQIYDICPAFGLALVSAAIAYPLGSMPLSSVSLVLLQAFIMTISYILLSNLLHIEAYTYVTDTVRDIIDRKRNRADWKGSQK